MGDDLVGRLTFSLAPCELPGGYVLLTWRRGGTRMFYGKRASQWRQCNTLGNVLLGILRSCQLCGYSFNANTYLNVVSSIKFMETVSIMDSFSRITYPATVQTMVQELSEECNN